MSNFLFFYDFAEKGAWPEAGGLNDQPVAFLEGVRLFRAEETRIKAALKIPAHD
jgi:hypothetical protein